MNADETQMNAERRIGVRAQRRRFESAPDLRY
jgi:hypothetical protein